MSYILPDLIGLFIMTKLKVINIGPTEWFSPHFSFNDNCIESFDYDPWKQDISLIDYCNSVKPDVLFIFRGDIVRSQLFQLQHIHQIEFSSEIYPSNPFSNTYSQWLGVKKFMHCMKDISPYANIFHYDKSRKGFLESLGLNVKYHFLPVNISSFNFDNSDVLNNDKKNIDLLFFGRASHRRSNIFAKIKERNLRFVWIENGLNWSELSGYITRSKVVLNFAADECDNFEPRILLALAGGAKVITEGSVGLDLFLKEFPGYSHKIKIVKPDSSAIIDAYTSFENAGNVNPEYKTDISFLSSNTFILNELGL
ncbi:hypothetical protein [Pantoea allii]|uniref:hypothetical protein n=2 Tax=Pantoea allii TaxID=574096 RepID=UPI001F4EA631|nr:hypothetical protein [Pantoea allii]MCH9298030.1 hypothetical protein [Pantoea allii]